MKLSITPEERVALLAAQAQTSTVRQWRRFQAILLRAEGVPVTTIAQTLACTPTSVQNWVAGWRARGVAGVTEGRHPGKARQLALAAEATLEALLATGDPQAEAYAATGWTVPLLRTQLGKQGWQASERTIRRTLHRLGWRWKRPKFVLGRPDPAYAEKKKRR